jgi:hypothetical protein
MSTAMLTIMAAFAQLERDTMIERPPGQLRPRLVPGLGHG